MSDDILPNYAVFCPRRVYLGSAVTEARWRTIFAHARDHKRFLQIGTWAAAACHLSERLAAAGCQGQGRRHVTWRSSQTAADDADLTNDSAAGCSGLVGVLGVGLLIAAIVALGLLLITGDPDRWEGVADPTEHPLSFVSDPRQSQTVYLGTEQGHILISHDGGQHWVEHHQGLPYATPLSALGLLPDDAGVVAGTTGGVYLSTDSGRTWQGKGTGLPRSVIVDAVTALRDGTLLAGTANNGIYMLRPSESDWAEAVSGLPPRSDVYTFLTLPQGGQVFAGLVAGGVYVSQDNGSTWAESDSGLGARAATDVFSLLTVPRAAGSAQAETASMLAGTSRGVYLSRDAGATWVPSSGGIGNVRVISLAHDQLVSTAVFAGTDVGVFQSPDGGATWHMVGYGLPPDQHVGVVGVIHPAGCDRVLLASVDQLYRYPGEWFLSAQPWHVLAMIALVLLVLALGWLVALFLRGLQTIWRA
jgi:photosystem II stability/assembly factor-like uncharacterized protein